MKWNEFKSVVDARLAEIGVTQNSQIDSMDFNLDMDDDGIPFTFRLVLCGESDPSTLRMENNPPKYTY
mgnify:FL=1